MGLFDLFKKKADTTTETLTNKVAEMQKAIETTPIDVLLKEKAQQKKQAKPERADDEGCRQIYKQRDNIRKNGFEEYEFIANTGCCEICAALNGKHFPLSEFEIGITAPPMHEGCRCSIAAYEDMGEYEAWLDFISKGGTTKEWEAMKQKQKR